MKKHLFISVGLLAIFALAARADQGLRCRDLPKTAGDTNLSGRITQDLLSGIWTKGATLDAGLDQVEAVVQFSSEGLVDFIERDPSGQYLTKSMHWRVEATGREARLLLEGGRQGRQIYRVDQTCEGVLLTDVHTSRRLFLRHNTLSRAAEFNRLQQGLVGSWSNSMYPFDPPARGGRQERIEGAFLTYELHADGTYTKSLGGNQLVVREKGAWELSKDGRFLLLHTTREVSGRRQQVTEIARIKYLQLDELVLEQALEANSQAFCTRRKDFFFYKL